MRKYEAKEEKIERNETWRNMCVKYRYEVSQEMSIWHNFYTFSISSVLIRFNVTHISFVIFFFINFLALLLIFAQKVHKKTIFSFIKTKLHPRFFLFLDSNKFKKSLNTRNSFLLSYISCHSCHFM